MDFGLGSFVEKFEKHYGKRATKILLGLVGAAAVCFCLGTIWQFIFPIGAFAYKSVSENNIWTIIGHYAFGAINVAIVIFAGATFASYVDIRRTLGSALRTTEHTQKLLDVCIGFVGQVGTEFEKIRRLQSNWLGVELPAMDVSELRSTLEEMRERIGGLGSNIEAAIGNYRL
jgi:hypothetical protein